MLQLCAHPADDLQHDPGGGLLEHGHGGAVGDALQAVPVHGQQPVPALELPVLAGRGVRDDEQDVYGLRASVTARLRSTWKL